MAMTTEQLRQDLRQRTQMSGLDYDCGCDGTINAQLAIIAEAPGETECTKKLPLVGSSGQLLWNVLRKNGIGRMDCYITNVSKRQVAFSDKDRKTLSKFELATWFDILEWELQQLPNLKYVLLLGNFALQALTGKTGITDWRGSVLDHTLKNGRKVKLVCAVNPAMVLREPKNEITFQLDMAKLRRVIDGKHNPAPITVHINPTFGESKDFLHYIRQQGRLNNPVSFDIEIISNETACIGFAASPTEAMCINFRDVAEQRYTLEQERILRRDIQATLLDDKLQLIAQNGMFDSYWLWYKDGIRVKPLWFDTMLAHHCMYPTLPHNLGFITTQYTDHPYYKDEKDSWKDVGNINNFWEYNGKDCCNTYAAAKRMLNELRSQKLDQFFFEHIMRLQPHLIRMTVGGIKMDMQLKEEIRNSLADECSRKLSEFHKAVAEATGEEEYYPNPKSPAQLSTLLFNKLKLVGRGVKTDKVNRQRMYAHPKTGEPAKKVLTTLDDFLADNKFLSTYAEMEVDEDGRARCEYKQIGVQSAPGRLSSSKVMWGSGMNLQNQPARAYPMFVADPGYAFCYFDMAQAEARLVAYFADIPLWKEQFERARRDGSFDAHRALAADMWQIPYDEVPTTDIDEAGHKTLRFVAKRCRHGLNYRMEADRLAQTTGLPLSEAYKAYSLYHRTTPELKRWWRDLEREVKETKCLYNAFGRRLRILERLTPEALESIVAFKPQSTLGDKVCQVIYQSHDDDNWPIDARIVLNIHDALIALAPIAKAKTCLRIMKKYAEQPIIIKGEPLIIPADCGLSQADDKGMHRWSTIKKVKDIEALP